MRTVSDDERRARLARRHAVAAPHRVASAEEATRAVVALHATEPATVHLSVAVRVEGFATGDLDRALHDERVLARQLAMRRTMFVFPTDLLPAAWGSASARVAESERKRVAKDVVAAGLATDGEVWLREAGAAVLAELGSVPEGLTTAELRERLPAYSQRVDLPSSQLSLAPGAHLPGGGGADRARDPTPATGGSSGRGGAVRRLARRDVDPLTPREGYAELVRRWLAAFGPGTTADLVWWLGSTKGAVSAALEDVGAVEVALEDGTHGWLLADDLEPEPPVEPWAALLPVLDPTVMGWKERRFYLGPHATDLFDRNGNAGTTAWVDGRCVGCWVQDADGVVVPHLLEDVPEDGRAVLAVEAARLTTWLDGQRVGTVYPSSAMKLARAATADRVSRVSGAGDAPPVTTAPSRSTLLRAVLLVLVLAGVVAAYLTGVLPDVDVVRDQVEAVGPLGPLVYVVAYAVLVMFPTPASVLTITGGALFGLVEGTALAMAGALLGAVGAFEVGRLLGRDAVERLTAGRLDRVHRVLDDHGLLAVLAIRLTPVFPYLVVNYAAGLSRLTRRDYALGTVIGIMPGAIAYAAVGAYGADPWKLFVAIVGLVVLTVLGAAAGRRMLRRGTRRRARRGGARRVLSPPDGVYAAGREPRPARAAGAARAAAAAALRQAGPDALLQPP